ncbi:MAG: hypothetical protein IJ418_20995 [Clostridia bacterium]|nr:hypothetical protein [Clostridia bacterium]
MEDFLTLLLIFIIYLIAGFSKKKKTKQAPAKKKAPMRTRAQGEQRDVRAALRDRQTMDGFSSAFAEPAAREDAPCAQQRIHLHEVSQQKLREAAEGEDPCHLGGEAAQEDGAYSEADGAQEALRQDVLRGVIMSEILTRPQERRAMQRSRREYHGY